MANFLSYLPYILTVLAVAGVLFGVVHWRRSRKLAGELHHLTLSQGAELANLPGRVREGLDGLGAALWEWSLPDDKIFLSDLFLDIVGYERDEFGRDAADFFASFHADEREETRRIFADYLAHRTAQCATDVRFRRKDGGYVWLHLRAVASWDNDGKPLTLVGSFSDITSKIEAEEERDRLFNLSADMLAVGGFDQYLQQINPAWVRVLGWSRDELMAHPLLHFVHPEDQEVSARAWELLREGTPVEGLENRFRCRDGSFRWLSWGSFPYADRQVVFSFVRDITDHKNAERKLLEYQDRLRALSSQLALVEERQRRHLAVAIHDGLAQQLFAIRAQLVLLKFPDKVPDLAGVVAELLDILDETMDDARSLSFEIFPPALYELGLDAAIVGLAHSFGERTGLNCRATTEGETAELPEDQRSMAYQCVRELLANVNKHAQATTVTITLNYVDCFLTIVVEDDGIGFDSARHERPPVGGSASNGFGLFSIRERLRSVQGALLVDSQPGQGTKIFMTFPHPSEDQPVPGVTDNTWPLAPDPADG